MLFRSVDDAVAAAIEACGPRLGSTFVIFTSDNGFNLGEFRLLMDKRHMYDPSTRVPLLVRGPGIEPGSVLTHMATPVDLAPTILGMAGVPVHEAAATIDGRSLLPLLVPDADGDSASTLSEPARHLLRAAGSAGSYAAGWRTSVLIEHRFVSTNLKCVANCSFDAEAMAIFAAAAASVRKATRQGGRPTAIASRAYPHGADRADLWCANLSMHEQCWQTPSDHAGWQPQPLCNEECYPTEDDRNNYAAVRRIDGALYAEEDGTDGLSEASSSEWRELYASDDTWQLRNLLHIRAGEREHDVEALEGEMRSLLRGAWLGCSGTLCP